MIEWVLLAVSVALVAACGCFVAAEFAFVTVDRGTVERAAESGDRSAQGVQAALQTLSTQLSGAQVGITVTNLAIGMLAEPAIAALIDGPLTAAGVPEGSVTGVAVTIGLVLATGFTMVFGELVPKNLAIAKPLATARATQGFHRGFTATMSYPIRTLNGSANALVRRMGIEPQEELRSARTSQELSSLIRRSASQGTLDVHTAGLMQRSVAFGDRTAAQIMTPRVRMASVRADESLSALLKLAQTTGHSRFPVVAGEAEDVVGAVHVKHVAAVPREQRRAATVRDIMIQPTVIPDSMGLDALMATLRRDGFQVAAVVDEYGGTAGVVTLEDAVEEIVGDITDEHDRPEPDIAQRPDGSWLLAGLLRPDEVASRTGIQLPEHSDYDTVAGLVLHRMGHLPDAGDTAMVALPPTVDDHGNPEPHRTAVLTVERLVGRRVDRLHLVVNVSNDPPATADEVTDAADA